MFGYNYYPNNNMTPNPNMGPNPNYPKGEKENLNGTPLVNPMVNPMYNPYYGNGCCQKNMSFYSECKPIVTGSKQVIEQYHVVKQPYVHNYHTEVVHHHVTQNEFIPTYSCSEVHVNDCCNGRPRV